MASQGMTALANFTIATAQATVTFSNIPATFRDLRLIVNGTAAGNAWVFLNGDSSTNYNGVFQQGNGSTATSTSYASNSSIILSQGFMGATNPSNLTIDFLDYSATDKHKPFMARFDNASQASIAWALRWANTAAITTIVLNGNGAGFAAGSTFALYGVSA